jgi:N-acetylmuramoyl-L-alanine amidase
MSVVVIDPGHGGSERVGGSSPNNATGPAGTLEKTLTLAVAQRVAAALVARGHQARLTRTGDTNLGLADRAGIAKKPAAAAFVSIHFNGDDDDQVQGTETWVHTLASPSSHELAAVVQRFTVGATGYRDRHVKAKTLGVLDPRSHHPSTAACLVEVSFLTDPRDEARLGDSGYLDQVGGAIAEGIAAHLSPAPRIARATIRGRAAIRGRAKGAKPRGRPRAVSAPDPIKHVVVVMLENRSFDHMLGSLRQVFPTLDGIDPDNPGRNIDPRDPDPPYVQKPTSTTALPKDPRHELSNVRHQLNAGGPCGGFVDDFRIAYDETREVTQEVMAYYDFGDLPVLHKLASEFTICDRWFSSVPGPTWTNRLFAHSGTSQGRVEMPNPPFDLNLHRYNQTTRYDRLNEKQIDWHIYFGDVPQSLVLEHQRRPRNAVRYRRFAGGIVTDSFAEVAAGPASEFPQFAFIEPNYFVAQNDQHPPSDVMHGEVLLARIYNALRANEALWRETLLVVLYDEHGGFYDHVLPGYADPPDGHHEEYTFDQFGVRVPALLVSPWVARRVLKTEMDHTSLLRYVSDKWGLGDLGRRTASASSFGDVFLPSLRRDTPERIVEPDIPRVRAALVTPPVAPPLNDLQRALFGLTEILELETPQPAEVKVARAARLPEGAQAQSQVAIERVERFLAEKRGRNDE